MGTVAIPELPGKKKPYVIAHRGNKIACPENTMAAFRRALDDGADIIETDLHVTRDREFICIHDPTIDRTTDGRGTVVEMTLRELKHFSAADGKPAFAGERIPALKELMPIIPDDAALALELKSDRFLDPDICRKLVDELAEFGLRDRTMMLSFKLSHLEAVKAVAPDIHIGWITLSRLFPLPGPQLLGPYWPLLLANPLYVRLAHRRNQAVCPLDPHPDSRLPWYLKLNCDAVLTDNPERTCRKLRELRG